MISRVHVDLTNTDLSGRRSFGEAGADCVASPNRSVPGHHGTRAEWAEKIEAEGFQPSQSDDRWLGDGAYFFEDAPDLADKWADMRHKRHETCVFEAEIHLGRCLDLLDGVGPGKLQPFYQKYMSLLDDQARMEFRQRDCPDAYGDFDCAVINWACSSLVEDGLQVDVVRGYCPIPGSGALYEDSELRSRFNLADHIQLAVRDNCAILNFRRKDMTCERQGHGAN